MLIHSSNSYLAYLFNILKDIPSLCFTFFWHIVQIMLLQLIGQNPSHKILMVSGLVIYLFLISSPFFPLT